MAQSSTRDVPLNLTVKTLGTESIKTLENQVRDLAKQGGDAAPEFKKLADEIARLGKQAEMTAQVQKLGTEVEALAQAEADAAAKAAEAAAKLKELQAATAAANATVAQATAAQNAAADAQFQRRRELDALKISTTEYSRTEDAYKNLVRDMALRINEAKIELRDLGKERMDAKAIATAAATAESDYAKTVQKLNAELQSTRNDLKTRNDSLVTAKAALEATGVATNDLAAANLKLTNSFSASEQAITAIKDKTEALRVAKLQQLSEDERIAARQREISAAQAAQAKAEADGIIRDFDRMKQAERDGAAAVVAAQKELLDSLNAKIKLSQQAAEVAKRNAAEEAAAEKAKADAIVKSEKEIADAAKIAAKELSDAFSTAGVRSVQQIQVEIDKIKTALNLLANSATVTGTDLERAFSAAKPKLDALEVELTTALNPALASVSANAKSTGDVLQNSFAAVGVRSAAAIKAEIEKVRTALNVLSTSATVTGAEFDKAFAAGSLKIKGLEQELNGVSVATRLTTGAMDLLKTGVAQAAAAFGAIEIGTKFFQANAQIETLRRSLALITGSTQTAAEKIKFLQDVADTSGQSIGKVSDAFIKFNASATSAGVSTEMVDRVFRSVVNASGQLGLSSDKSSLALDALSQMASKGTVSMEELRQQLGDALPGAMSIAAKGLKVTQEELVKLVETGNLTTREFFPAFLRGMEQTFGSSEQTVNSVVAAFNRMKNAFTAVAQQASDTAAFKALGTSMDFIATHLQAAVDVTLAFGKALLALKITEAIAGFLGFGNAAKQAAADVTKKTVAVEANTVATVANTTATTANTVATVENAVAVRTLSNGFGALPAITSAAATAIGAAGTNIGNAFIGITNAAKGAFAAIGGLPGVLITVIALHKELGTWIGEAIAKMMGWGKVLDDNEKKLAAQAAAEKAAAAERRKAAEELDIANAKAVQASVKLREAAEGELQTKEKHLKATEAQAVAVNALVALQGNETLTAKTAAEQAAKVAEAKRLVVVATEDVVKKTLDEINAIAKVGESNGRLTQVQQDQLKTLRQLVADKTEMLARAKDEALAAQVEAASRKAVSEAYVDNSKRIGELRQNYENAKAALEVLQLSGVASLEQLNAAQLKVSESSKLVQVEIKRQTDAIDRDARQKDASISITSALTSVSQQHNEAMAAGARASGDSATATYYDIQAKRDAIKILQLKAEHDKIANQAELDTIALKRTVIDTTTLEGKAQMQLLDIQEKVTKSKMVMAGATEEQIKQLERQIQLINQTNGALNNLTNNYNTNTVAIRRNQEELDKKNLTGDGFKKNADGSAQGSFNSITANGDLARLQEKQRNGTLSANDLAAAEVALSQAQAGKDWLTSMQSVSVGSVSTRASNDAEANLMAAKMLIEQIKSLQRSTSSGTGVKTNSTTQPGSGNRTVTINIGGSSQTINVASDEDQQKLANLLQQLGNASKRT